MKKIFFNKEQIKIADKKLAKKLNDYMDALQTLNNNIIYDNNHGKQYYPFYPVKYIGYNNVYNLLISDKKLSTYKNEVQTKFLLDVMKNGLFSIIDNDEFDRYSYYNKILMAHKRNGEWISVDNLSNTVKSLMLKMYVLIEMQGNNSKEGNFYTDWENLYGFKDWTLMFFFDCDEKKDIPNWTIIKNGNSIESQFDLFEKIFDSTNNIYSVKKSINEIINNMKNISNYISPKFINTRHKLALDITDPLVWPETPIPYDLVTGFQFIEWLMVKQILDEK